MHAPTFSDLATIVDAEPWIIYVLVAASPFVQEDAAVLTAATTAATGEHNAGALFASVLLGLTASDMWKYGAGALARRAPLMSRVLTHDTLTNAAAPAVRRLGVALFVARFVPGSRIPLYVACGALGAPVGRFFLFLFLAGATYVSAAFLVMQHLGKVLPTQSGVNLVCVGAAVAAGSLVFWIAHAARLGRWGATPRTVRSAGEDIKP